MPFAFLLLSHSFLLGWGSDLDFSLIQCWSSTGLLTFTT